MTDETDTNPVEMEQLLKAVRPAGPSALLQEQVVGAARQAWNEAALGTPWRVAIGRLAVAAAAAVFIVSGADYLSNRAIAPWRPQGLTAANVADCSVEEFPEISFGPLLRHVAALHGTAGHDASGALAYRERLHEMLTETEHDSPADTPAPAEGRSRLLPARPELHYS
jgi:hypothetical protein